MLRFDGTETIFYLGDKHFVLPLADADGKEDRVDIELIVIEKGHFTLIGQVLWVTCRMAETRQKTYVHNRIHVIPDVDLRLEVDDALTASLLAAHGPAGRGKAT